MPRPFAIETPALFLPSARINQLRAKQRAKTETQLEISRERITQHVGQLALHGKSEMVQLKAIEVLNKMQGYNEPSVQQHQHLHLQVDSSVIEQKAGHTALIARASEKVCLPLPGEASAAVAESQ
jgi:hypothetical protein